MPAIQLDRRLESHVVQHNVTIMYPDGRVHAQLQAVLTEAVMLRYYIMIIIS